MEVIIPVLLLLFLIFVGMPVGFAMGTSGLIGLMLVGGSSAVSSIMSTVPYRTVASFTLTTIPMFILMAEFISESRIVKELFDAAQKWLGRIPGGLAIATVIASAAMGAMSGSSTATAATMSSITVPEMRKAGYKTEVATGVVAVAGTLAIMIPPSIPLVIYGITTETSIGKLLIAGIIPGLLTALVYSVGILIWNKVSPGVMPGSKAYSWKEKINALRPLQAFLVLIFIVIGALYTGIATPTESAALGASGALIISLAYRRIDIKGIYQAVFRTAKSTTMIATIIMGAMVFGYFLTLTQATQNAINFIGQLNVPNMVILVFIILLYVALGCILDQIAILLLTLPLTFPLMTGLGYDAVWFGVIATKLAEIGLVTPPVGMNVYVVGATTKVPLEKIFKGTGVMLLMEVITLALLIIFPAIATWLPSNVK